MACPSMLTMVICTLVPFTCVPLLARAWGWTCMVWDNKILKCRVIFYLFTSMYIYDSGYIALCCTLICSQCKMFNFAWWTSLS